MVFSSIPFLFFFFPLCLIFYFLTPNRFKNYVLLVFSLIFYAWGEPIYIFLMIVSTLVDFINGRILSKNNNEKTRKRFLIIAILINLSLLGVFKYADFVVDIINHLFNTSIDPLHLSLPIGISFYTFQTMSYSIDVYRRVVEPETNYFRYLTYVSMFPQLIAGPIVRYETINKELHERKISFNQIGDGFYRFLTGLYKKVLLGNTIGKLNATIMASNLSSQSTLTLWLGIIAYALQIYFDFSGYSDMAIGMGKMLGFSFNENFDYPYTSKSITEFWRRWHISLGTWFKDYVMFPLLKSRLIQKLQRVLKEKVNKNVARKTVSVLGIGIVFFVTGLWHGANYNFLLWGMYYGVILIIEELFLKKYLDKNKLSFFNHLYVIFVVLIGYTIFSIEDLSILGNYLKMLFNFKNIIIDSNFMYYLTNYGLLIVLGIFFSLPIWKNITIKYQNNKIFNIVVGTIYLVLFIISVCYLVSDTYNPFMYFRF